MEKSTHHITTRITMDYTHHTAHGAYYITSCLAHAASQGKAGNTRSQIFYLFCKINGGCFCSFY